MDQPTNGQDPPSPVAQNSQHQEHHDQRPQVQQGQQLPQRRQVLQDETHDGAQQHGTAQQLPPLIHGRWKSDKDNEDRRKMIANMLHPFKKRKPNAPPEWREELRQMAKAVEKDLYMSARSIEEYNDASTLKQGVQQLATRIEMGMMKSPQQLQGLPKQQKNRKAQPQHQPQSPPPQAQAPQQASQTQFARPTTQQLQPQTQQAHKLAPVQQPAAPQPRQQRQQQLPHTGGQRKVNKTEMNPKLGGRSQTLQLPAPAAPQQPTPGSGTRQVSDRQQMIQHQRKRLLLLSHAAKCRHKGGSCPESPRCAEMKQLLKHIAESVHRSKEEQNQKQASKQSHQQAIKETQMQSTQAATSSGPSTASGPLAQSVQQSSVIEPPNKLRKIEGSLLQPPGFQVQPRPRQQPSRSRAAISTQPSTVLPGYSYRQAKLAPQMAAVPGLASANGQHSGPDPQVDHTLINSFSVEQIETHIASLSKELQLPPQKLKTKCLEVLETLQSHQHGWVFNKPVDPVELGLTGYFEVIKKPVDLGTIRKKLKNGVYRTLDEFEGHVNLTFDNAMLYNPEGSVVYNMAKEMKEKFQHDYKKLIDQLNAEEDTKRRTGEACCLCGCEKLSYGSPVFCCDGENCSKKIPRNGCYYVAGSDHQYHWCPVCYDKLSETITLGDFKIEKESLVAKKNVHEESWVQCERCERWVHQICALFNSRQNTRLKFACPQCTIEERKKKGRTEGTSSTLTAEDLPRTKLSDYLENHVRQKVDESNDEESQKKATAEGCTVEEARKKLPIGGAITIRQVTSMDKKLKVGEQMKSRYVSKNFPEEFKFRSKCVIVFQKIDGVDTILFVLYVDEHGEESPLPNMRTVYIAYLDNVRYMRPQGMRTFVYHEILISYLDYARNRGFATAHIWSCPPLKGDNYILYGKPEDQKTPKVDRLCQWYVGMLEEAQRRGIVGKLTNMYDLYFSDVKNDATVLPYFDGDYFPSEIENIIMEEQKKRRNGVNNSKNLGKGEERDNVMGNLGKKIQPTKETFIVAYLAWERAREEDMEVPKEIQEYREKHGITWKIKSEKEKPKEDNSDGTTSIDECRSDDAAGVEKAASSTKTEPVEVGNAGDVDGAQVQSDRKVAAAEEDAVSLSIRDEDKLAGKAARKRNREGTMVDAEAENKKTKDKRKEMAMATRDSNGRIVEVLDDDRLELDCKFLNNRHDFLNLCQGMPYQFDQLRRAKYSSMMVLWHLYNHDAPLFVQQCAACLRELLTGYHFHCPSCADYYCRDCVCNPREPKHPHPLEVMLVARSPQMDPTEALREERIKRIRLQVELLLHSVSCDPSNCSSADCTKMRDILKHSSLCQVKATGACRACKRIWTLLVIHARKCKAKTCQVPNCMTIRERLHRSGFQETARQNGDAANRR